MIHAAGWNWSQLVNVAEDDEAGLLQWFNGLPWALSCVACGVHCKGYIGEHPPPIKGTAGTKELFWWTVDFHNAVNKRLGKRIYSRDEAEREFADLTSNQSVLDAYNHDVARRNDTKAFCNRWSSARLGAKWILGVATAAVVILVIVVSLLLFLRGDPTP